MEARFEIAQGDVVGEEGAKEPGAWYWHLKAGNGEIIAQSEGYTSQQHAEEGVDAVKRGVLAAVGVNPRVRVMETTIETIEEAGGKLSVCEPIVRHMVEVDVERIDELPV